MFLNELYIEIPGKPVPKGRPRFNMKTGRIYTAKKTLDEEKRIHVIIIGDHNTDYRMYNDFRGLVVIDLMYYLPFASHLKKAEKIESIPHIIKPDLDNLIKLTIDAITGVLFYDDNQVGQINASKLQSATPKTTIKISYHE